MPHLALLVIPKVALESDLIGATIIVMSTTIFAVFVQLAVAILPVMGIQVGSAELTNALQTILVIVTGLWIWFKRVQTGDVKWFGKRNSSYTNY